MQQWFARNNPKVKRQPVVVVVQALRALPSVESIVQQVGVVGVRVVDSTETARAVADSAASRSPVEDGTPGPVAAIAANRRNCQTPGWTAPGRTGESTMPNEAAPGLHGPEITASPPVAPRGVGLFGGARSTLGELAPMLRCAD